MSDLQSIARDRAQADLKRRIDDLLSAIQAIQHELAAKGMLKSGVMLKCVTSACVDAIRSYEAVVITEYRWAVSQSLLATQSWVDGFTAEANGSFAPLIETSIGHIRKAVSIAGGSGKGPDLTTRLVEQLDAAHTGAQNDIRLALRAAFTEKGRSTIRKIPSAIVEIFSKLFGGGRP